jgi:hypothetical protein
MSSHSIRNIRIDVPAGSTCVYLFFDPTSDPWWASLFEYLSEFAQGLVWQHEPIQDVYIARPSLADEDRIAILRFLQTAPSSEIETHQTLRRAIALDAEQARRLDVVYFSARPTI